MNYKPTLALAIAIASTSYAYAENYGEALQKSIYFYEAQQSGELPDWNRVEWRGDSALTDGADNNVDLTGGWYDAGDHVKFGFPMAATATMLAWGVIENPDAYEQTGQLPHIKNNLRFVADYFVKAHTGPNEFYGQVGKGSVDHAWWGSAEVMPMARPSYKIDAANPGTDLAGETAAALAAIAMVFETTDPAYAQNLLTHAEQLYQFADTYRGKYSDSITDAQAFYNSWSGYQDELVWGAAWLYQATGNPDYLTKAINEYDNLNTEPQSTIKSYKWGQAWDDKGYGSYVLLAKLTGDAQYEADAERWLDYWTTGYNGERIRYTPGGLAFLDTWGAARYTSNTSFLALVYSDYLKNANKKPVKADTYYDFARSQIEYLLGDNPMNMSYLIGYGDVYPTAPHHRTAHGAWADSLSVPTDNRHTLVGALVGGPGLDDSFENDRGDYVKNEVATDYNAGFTGALARLWKDFGGQPIDDAQFPMPEPRDNEFFVEAKVNASGPRHIEIATLTHNRSAWPSRNTDQLKFRYWVDLTEEMAAGYEATDVSVSTAYNQASSVTGLTHWRDNLYYAEVSFAGVDIYPGGQSESKKEVQFRLSLPTNTNAAEWDNTSDPSWDNYSNSFVLADKIALYDGNTLVWGEEPSPGCGADSGINCAPTANAIQVDTAFESAVTLTLSGQDSDGTVTDVRLTSQPSNGSVSLSGSSATYQPDSGFFGTDQFQYVVTDNDGADSAPAEVTINVDEPMVPAVVITSPADNSTVAVDSTVTLMLDIRYAAGVNVYVNNQLTSSRVGDGPVTLDTPSQPTTWVVDVVATDEQGQEIGATDTLTLQIEDVVVPDQDIQCEVPGADVWNTGFVISAATVTNAGDEPVDGWTVTLQFDQPITVVNSWGANTSLSSDGLTLTASNVSYNGTLSSGGSTTFGLQGGHGGNFTIPSCLGQ
ncbi:glycoside hydrolase family 9 protein [Reinekea blandensis]|uniref:Endoglucanase n=1 Tax=Reinekea blandensis MED297 TaxID=314283 RepID=A4BCU5_9GAMM|nr:glycoside hydrolase family 9 protein [Reinekea blandensis]EAR10027.1 probable cellulase [Reinekea sp. MED297] [Reinekea blandensis MED297]